MRIPSYLVPVGSIAHNERAGVRVVLYSDENGQIWACANDEPRYLTDYRVEEIKEAYSDPNWELELF